MKPVIRLDEPDELAGYRAGNLRSTWDQMRGDATGRTAYEAIRFRLVNGQGGLCGYCEIDIRDNDSLKDPPIKFPNDPQPVLKYPSPSHCDRQP